jgi:hypothetical protein
MCASVYRMFAMHDTPEIANNKDTSHTTNLVPALDASLSLFDRAPLLKAVYCLWNLIHLIMKNSQPTVPPEFRKLTSIIYR